MHRFFRLLLIIAACITTITSCKDEDEKENDFFPKKINRTVLVYMAADNTLYMHSSIDIEEMLEGMKRTALNDVRLLVYWDNGSFDSPTLYETSYFDNRVVFYPIKHFNQIRNSVGKEETKEVFDMVFNNPTYATGSFGLVYWSHGNGWIPSLQFDNKTTRSIGEDHDNDRTTSMNIEDLSEILDNYPKLDFLLMDACYMQCVEAAYALRNNTRWYLATPTSMPGTGGDYSTLVKAMFSTKNGADYPLQIAKEFFAPYKADYNPDPTVEHYNLNGGLGIAAVKTSELDALMKATGTCLKTNVADLGKLPNMRSVLQYDESKSEEEGYVGFCDFDQVMQVAAKNSNSYNNWKKAFKAACPLWLSTPKYYPGHAQAINMEESCGMSIFVETIESRTRLREAYMQTEWYKDLTNYTH